ncbi:sugar-binding transcriptional regulator [Gimesia aquarii]|uniref:Sugar-binding domain protein n=1 Tax=Gimesia aquarii TaxID=2527964 RepID=A0A517VPE8_9PLAN|nr:sugar-binding domain-containing protein [Gimesia aquarii]QDT94843.1 Putative sugar-binding domain protein [Gimesia aquarii]
MCDKQEVSIDLLLSKFQDYLQNRTTLPKIAQEMGIKPAKLRDTIRLAYLEGAITIQTPEVRSLRDKLNENWPGPRYHVLRADDHRFFFKGAATVFLRELDDVLTQREADPVLNVGIVSGRTTGGVVDSLCSLDWSKYLRRERFPPRVNVFALNVSQTSGFTELSGNANVLAFQLARKFADECSTGAKIEAFGLSTELLQTLDERTNSDIRPQTRNVLMYTNPERLRRSLELRGEQISSEVPSESQLDVIITGVGTICDSLFRDYCSYYKVNIDYLRNVQHIVGDIAYCPVTRVGEHRQLSKNDSEYQFYSAVSLDVLGQISSQKTKKVILVARNAPERDKVDPIHAAIAGATQYCNVLITDHETADKLHKTMALG